MRQYWLRICYIAHHFDGVFISNGPGEWVIFSECFCPIENLFGVARRVGSTPLRRLVAGLKLYPNRDMLTLKSLSPTHCVQTVQSLRTLFQTSQLPIFGICLGHQLVALAAGATTSKLKVSREVDWNLFRLTYNSVRKSRTQYPLVSSPSNRLWLCWSKESLDLTTGRVHVRSS